MLVRERTYLLFSSREPGGKAALMWWKRKEKKPDCCTLNEMHLNLKQLAK